MPAFKKNNKSLKKKRSYKKKPAVSKSVKLYIAKTMNKKEEHKLTSSGVTNAQVIVYGTVPQAVLQYDCRDPFVLCTQSAGQGGRIGNQINVTSCRLKGFISITGATITSNIYIRMIVLRTKQDILPVNGTLANLFQFGNNVLPPVGTLQDMIRYVNKDFYTVYGDKKVLLGSSDGTTSTLAMNNTMGNIFFNFDLMKCWGGKVLWNESSTAPTNKACYLIFVPCNADGTAVTALQLAPYKVSVNMEVAYTDV